MISAFFGCPIFLHSIGFLRSFAHFPFSSFLSLSLSLFLFSIVYELLFPFYLSLTIFLSFFLRWVPDILMLSVALCSFCFFMSLQLHFFVLFFSLIRFFCLSPPLAFSQARFFCFPLCFQPSFFSVFWVFLIFNLFALQLIIFFCCYRSISFSPSL